MALQKLPGSAQRYVDTETGQTLSRRQAEKQLRPQALESRETRYKLEKAERRARTGFIPRETLSDNRRYWLQRYAEQAAVRNGTNDRVERARAMMPGSEFNRLWARSEAQGFEGGPGSAWDALAWRSGAKGGAEDANERSKYLAVIAWYMRNDTVGNERWVARGGMGRFEWPGMPDGYRTGLAS